MIGIDEVGRGAFAGPMVVCAVRCVSGELRGVADSKTLSKKKRELLYAELVQTVEYSLGWVSSDEIDDLGLSSALKLAASKALEGLNPTVNEEVIVDGIVSLFPAYDNEQLIVKADAKIPSVGAASILAKVVRDNRMKEYDALYPEYGFAAHVGYGTLLHKAAIDRYGLSDIHRKSFVIK